eukprot:1273324-Amorphochlora_amoeboformis.AAC.1
MVAPKSLSSAYWDCPARQGHPDDEQVRSCPMIPATTRTRWQCHSPYPISLFDPPYYSFLLSYPTTNLPSLTPQPSGTNAGSTKQTRVRDQTIAPIARQSGRGGPTPRQDELCVARVSSRWSGCVVVW